jgi:hypothetical protein
MEGTWGGAMRRRTRSVTGIDGAATIADGVTGVDDEAAIAGAGAAP